jgi:hypothetical protein
MYIEVIVVLSFCKSDKSKKDITKEGGECPDRTTVDPPLTAERRRI